MRIRTNLGFISLLLLPCILSIVTALYELPDSLSGAITVVPNTLQDLKNALCNKYKGKKCLDDTLKIIKVTKAFDFRGSEGQATELGCYHRSKPAICKQIGQLKLNVANQCKGLEPVMVTYDKAGRNPLLVGSNKYIIGEKGVSAIIGKGLKIAHAHDIFIHGLNITDINAQVIWAGDAVSLESASNVLFDGNYISRIGRQMLVTHYGGSQNITVSNNEFDGNSPWANHCDHKHFWLWLFLGQNDIITLVNNTIHDTSGRGPHITGLNHAKVFLHMINNRFENVTHAGLIESREITSRILAEGNYFKDVSEIVHTNIGPTFLPKSESEAEACREIIGRKCLVNIIDNPKGKIKKSDKAFKSDKKVLYEVSNYNLKDAKAVGEQVSQLKAAVLYGVNLTPTKNVPRNYDSETDNKDKSGDSKNDDKDKSGDSKNDGKDKSYDRKHEDKEKSSDSKKDDNDKSGDSKNDKGESDVVKIPVDEKGVCFDSLLQGIKNCRSSILQNSKNAKKIKLSKVAAMEEYEKNLLTCLCEKYMVCNKSC